MRTLPAESCSLPSWVAAFAYVHSLFRNPSPEQHEWLLSHDCQSVWGELNSEFGLDAPRLEVPSEYDDYAQRFIATFDIGTPNPPVPLIESHYNRRDPIPRILHENILYYRQFGLQLRDSALESADHLRHQLELTQHLIAYHDRLNAMNETEYAGQVARALRDFVTRHLASWIPKAIGCAEDASLAYAGPALRLVDALCGLVSGPNESERSTIE